MMRCWRRELRRVEVQRRHEEQKIDDNQEHLIGLKNRPYCGNRGHTAVGIGENIVRQVKGYLPDKSQRSSLVRIVLRVLDIHGMLE